MRAFAGEYRAVKVHVLVTSDKEYVDGERAVESFNDPVDTTMVPRPVTLSQEKHLPEGKYKTGDMKFYKSGPVLYKSGDIIEHENIKYRIGDISSRSEGGFVYYMGKRIYDQA